MKKISILLLALCAYSSAISQITLTKDVSYGNNGAVDFSLNSPINLVWNRRYITPNNYVVICPLDDSTYNPSYAKFYTYDPNGNLVSTITLPAQGDASVLYADNNNVYPVADGKLYKYSINGNLDTSFGNNGELTIGSNLTATNYLTAAYLPDGKILVRNQDSFIRYNANGTVDTSYGNNGSVAITGPTMISFTIDERINNDYFFENSGGRRKININTGVLDLSYGNNGYSVTSTQPEYVPFDPEAVTNNFEIITFLHKTFSPLDYAISKTKTDGNIDNTFGNSGMVYMPQTFNNKALYYGLTMGIDDYNNKIFIPITITPAQGDQNNWKTGILCYSMNAGNQVLINGASVYETGLLNASNTSIEIRGNYLYLFTQGAISRYIISDGVLNTQETKTASQINFINPFSNELNFNSNEKIKQIEIYDESGRLILKEKDKKQVNTSHLNKGVYIIKITTDSNKIISKKAIKN